MIASRLAVTVALVAAIAAAPVYSGWSATAVAATAPPLPGASTGGILGPPGAEIPGGPATLVPESPEPSGPQTPPATAPANGTNVQPFSGASGPVGTPPPLSATATPSPSGAVVKYTGQLLDDRRGFVFFTTGDGFRLASGVKIADAATGGPTALAPQTLLFARASFDTGNGQVVELDLSRKRLPAAAAYEDIKKFAIARSAVAPNPDLRGGVGFNGKPVLVTFKVRVPDRTPFTDDVYLATSASNWSATEIKMSRIDALNYQVTREFPSGTTFEYRYTRGSWRSAERGQDGLEDTHKLTVGNSDTQNRSDVVGSWGDQNQAAPDLGSGSIPTPFQAIPFVLPPRP